MRQSLMETFRLARVVDLHGSGNVDFLGDKGAKDEVTVHGISPAGNVVRAWEWVAERGEGSQILEIRGRGRATRCRRRRSEVGSERVPRGTGCGPILG
jgi:hypothetical protein